jgi:hypothetical protein
MDFRPITIVGARRVLTTSTDRQVAPILTSGDPAQRSGVDLAVDNGFSAAWDLASWNSPVGWTNVGAARHSPGDTAALSQSVPTAGGSSYVVYVPAQNVIAGYFEIRANGVIIARYDPATFLGVGAFQAAGSSTNVEIVPSVDFDGDITYVRIDAIVPSANQAMTQVQATTPGLGTTWFWVPGEGNLGIGQYTLSQFAYFSGFSDRNTAISDGALASLRWGTLNCAFGFAANGEAINVSRTTALGALSKADHANTVALGVETETAREDSIAVGDRDIEIQGAGRGVILRSPNNTLYRLTVDNAGALLVTPL